MKSGTTMVRSLLGRHDNIYAGLETHWFDYSDGSEGVDTDFIVKLQKLFDVPDVLLVEIMQDSKTSNLHFIDCFLGRLTKEWGKSRWVEKTPGNIDKVGEIFRLWPAAVFLHIIRDFRDVFASWKLSGKTDIDFFINSVLGSHAVAVSWEDDPRFRSIYYEELVARPEQIMGSLLKWLREPEQAECYQLDLQKSREEFDRVLEATGKASNTLMSTQKQIATDKIGSYLSVLKSREILLLERELSEPLSHYGYL